MAAAVIERGWRESSAETIETDLACVWQETARSGPVSRAVMSNLLVFCRCPAGADVDLAESPHGLPIDDVAAHHPARIILLHHDPDACDTHAEIAAQVGVLVFGSSDARYGVEQIAIRSACPEDALPSIVRRLTLGDVPTTVWWTEDFTGTRPLAALVTMGRQLVYDSRRSSDFRQAVLALAPLLAGTPALDLADVNWRRLLPVRRGILHALGTANCDGVESIRIRHQPHEAALAWLLAGWVQSHLAHLFSNARIAVDQDALPAGELLTASFDEALRLRAGVTRVAVETAAGPFSLPIPLESEAAVIVSELHNLAHDAVLHSTLATLIQRFSAV
jgi:glucose-6-phosphate dehydrogenase assembly protein OpcA